MRLFSYVLDHDFGFAPNPFYGVCTLATCKPRIRATAAVGDVIVGTGAAKRHRRGYLVYYMQVDEILTYDQYWADERFGSKKPYLNGSKMQAFGDNIYHRDGGKWCQANSFHSLPTGAANPLNLNHDTTSERVLVGYDFAYWGGSGPEIPRELRDHGGQDLCAQRGHKVRFSESLVLDALTWLGSFGTRGFVAPPTDWARSP